MHLKKKLIYRSVHRGSKENEFLLSSFVQSNIDNLSHQEIKVLDSLLNESDLDIFIWITKKSVDIPEKYVHLIERIIQFNKL